MALETEEYDSFSLAVERLIEGSTGDKDFELLVLALDAFLGDPSDSQQYSAPFNAALTLESLGLYDWAQEFWEVAASDRSQWGEEASKRLSRPHVWVNDENSGWRKVFDEVGRCLDSSNRGSFLPEVQRFCHAYESLDETSAKYVNSRLDALRGSHRAAPWTREKSLLVDGVIRDWVTFANGLREYRKNTPAGYRASESLFGDVVQRTDEDWLGIVALRHQGLSLAALGRLQSAVANWREALQKARHSQYAGESLELEILLAEAAAALGNPPHLVHHHLTALSFAEKTVTPMQRFKILEGASRTAESFLAFHSAEALQRRASVAAEETSSPYVLASALERLAALKAEIDQLDEAILLLARAADLLPEIDAKISKGLRAQLRVSEARAKLDCCPRQSLQASLEAVDGLRNSGLLLQLAEAAHVAGLAARNAGDERSATSILFQAVQYVADIELSGDSEELRRSTLDKRRSLYSDLLEIMIETDSTDTQTLDLVLRAKGWQRGTAALSEALKRAGYMHGVVFFASTQKLHAWVVGSSGVRRREARITWSELSAKVQTARHVLRRKEISSVGAHTMGTLPNIVGQLLDELPGTEPLAVSLDGPLYYLPVEWIFGNETGAVLRESVQLSSALRTFTEARTKSLLIASNADSMETLTNAAAEVREIAQFLPNVEFLVDDHATAEAVLGRLPSAAKSHFAAHAESSASGSWEGRIFLGESQLTASDIRALDLTGHELAVLAGCSTRVGRISPSIGPLSIAAAFHQAGTRRVISTLWAVDDEASRELMNLFYRELDQGSDPALALSRAKEALAGAYPLTAAAFQMSRLL